MSMQLLLSELSERGVTLRAASDGQLSISAPKGKLPESLLAQIRQRKGELLGWLGGGQAAPPQEPLPTIEPDRERLHEPFPLADLQTSFLMGERPEMELYVRPHYYVEHDHDGLDPVRYEQALNRVLARQAANLPILTDDLRLQIPREHAPVKVKVQDLRGRSDEEVQRALEDTRARMSRQTLPLDRWPWVECSITLHGQGKARLHYNNNNFFSDGYGSQKLLEDAMRVYQDPSLELPPLTLSFRDCVEMLARIEASPRGQASRKYWQDRIPSLPAAFALPLAAGQQSRRRSRLVRRQLVLPESIWAGFKRRARAQGLTPTNAVYAAYAELAAHWSGTRHFLLNNMVTHRFPIHPEIKSILGNFASLYPLEVDWRSDEPFFQKARKLQERVLSDLQHVYCTGVSVLQALNQARRSTGRAGCPFVVGSGLFMDPMERSTFSCLETSQVLLDHQFWELPDGGFWAVWDLIEDAFPSGLIDAMWGAWERLLRYFAESDAPWSQRAFDVLPDDQRAQRRSVNATQEAFPDARLHDALLATAARSPGKQVAIEAGRALSYAELVAQAGALAGRLRANGIQGGDRVPIVLEKGVDQAIAAYGILMAGGAYVPIDPGWPAERARYVVEQTQATQAVTRSAIRDAGLLPAGLRLVCVDEATAAAGAAQPAAQQDPGTLAYVIFTSGSTGTPKGVAIDHAGAMNTIFDVNRRFGIGASDRLFGISSLSFDLSVYDLFGSVAAGGSVVVPTGKDVTDPQAWLRMVQEQGITVWNSVPALVQLLVDAALAAGVTLPQLRVVMMSGDWIPVTLPAQLRKVAPNARIISLGGATEASIWSIFYPIEKDDPSWVSVPYGRPLANQRWRILDDTGMDAPNWVPGHLYVGGKGLALGYFGDTERTEAAFAVHAPSGERLYRTGDLGRYLPDGDIEFLGRSDFQVKIQGYRIELGEVEQGLLAHPSVGGAVVLARSSAGGKRLEAFVTAKAGQAVEKAAVLTHMRAKVPSYMVPSVVHVLERFPLTGNGKLDREALGRAAQPGESERPPFVAPRTTVEEELAAIWEEVLGVKPVGAEDDFFELGGQSIAALAVVTRIARRWGRSLSLGAMLEGRTVARLAQMIERLQTWNPLVPLETRGDGTPWFFVHPAGGNVLCYRQLAGALHAPFYAFQAAGLDGGLQARPAATVEEMATRYAEALREVRPHGPYRLGGWSSGGVVAFEMARQLERAGEVVERVALLDTPSPALHALPGERALLDWFIEDLDIGIDAAGASRLRLPERAAPEELLAAALGQLGERAARIGLDARQLSPVFDVFRAVVTACRNYGGDPVAADLLVLRASQGRVTEFLKHPADAEADWGWRHFTRGRVVTGAVPGTHYTILAPGNLPVLVGYLDAPPGDAPTSIQRDG